MPEIQKYVSTSEVEHNGKKGILLKIESPANKFNTISFEVLTEAHRTLEDIASEEQLAFIIFCGSTGKIHAGADIRLFSGEIDSEQVRDYLMAGTRLDLKIKELSRTKRTVSIMSGKRFGGSVELPLMTQYSVCTPETIIQFSESNLGVIPGWDGILNILLRSTKLNALYLAATGNQIGAQQMLEAGLVTGIYPKDLIFEKALEMATTEVAKSSNKVQDLVDSQTLEKIISSRTDSSRYQKLLKEITKKMEQNISSFELMGKDGFKQYIQDKLNLLGKPIAPASAKAVFDLVNKYEMLNWQDEKGIEEMAFEEAKLCNELMKTQDRRTGMKSVLSDNPLDAIPIYVGN